MQYARTLRGVIALRPEEALQRSRQLARELLEEFRDRLDEDYPLQHDEVARALDNPLAIDS